jgi:CBS domain-containing protein
MNKKIFKYLAEMPQFKPLNREDIVKLAGSVEVREYNNNEVIAKQNQTKIDHIYVILKGQLSLFHDKQGQRSPIGYIKKGEIFGGISLLLNGGISLRTAQVDGQVMCYLIPKELYLDLCGRKKEFYEYFIENFSKNIFDPSLPEFIETAQVKRFLMGIPPFSFLPEDEINALVDHLSMVHYQADTVLFVQGKSRIGYLYILRKGSAERYYENGDQKTMIGLLSEGDIFGGISMLSNDGISLRTLHVKEDSDFYILPKKIYLDLCSRYEIFSGCLRQADDHSIVCRAIIAKTLQPQGETLQLFNQPLKGIYSSKVSIGHTNMTIKQAAQAMRQDKSSYLLIEDATEKRHGIITDSDLTRKVIAQGIDPTQQVEKVMSTPLITISSQSQIFEALITMMQKDIKRLAVTDADDRIVGTLSIEQLLAAQEKSPLFILHQIEQAQNMDAITDNYKQVPDLIHALITNGASAQNVTRIITTLSDSILNKVMQFTLNELGTPPARFVFMIMGSEGRKEQSLKTDQDNAIIYEDVSLGQKKVRDYFLKFGEIACGMLNHAGYDYCKGDVMAKNPQWCQPLSVWKQYFSGWIHAAEPKDLLQASIFFDFRGAFGDLYLTDELRRFLFGSLGDWSGFFRHLTENALHFKPPLGLFRNFVVESKGAHRDAFNIKSAIMPIVDFARVYALKHRIEETNTWERIYKLRVKQVVSQQESDDLEKAYSFLMQMRFVQQVNASINENSKPDNYLKPKNLTNIEQTTLKEIFKHVEKFQGKMKFDYIGA